MHLKRVAEVIGPAAAVRLAESVGNLDRVYIPKTATIAHRFTAVIGLDKLELLCAHPEFSGKEIDIPKGTFRQPKKLEIMDATGSSSEIALRCNVTQRYVRKVLSPIVDENQPDLFSQD